MTRSDRPRFGEYLRLAVARELADGARVSMAVCSADHACAAERSRLDVQIAGAALTRRDPTTH